MKIKQSHFDKLKQAIDTTEPDGLSPMRIRWDALRNATIDGKSGIRWICDNLYSYLDDSHIDTALRRIFNHPD